MKKNRILLMILMIWTSLSWSQTISEKDSLGIMEKAVNVFDLFSNPNFADFKKTSTEKIYCIICFNRPDFKEKSYMLDRKEFFDNHLKKINRSDSFTRAKKSNEIIFIKGNVDRSDIVVLFTIYEKDELAFGHEGGQLGIHFKKVNGEFKFAGLETIP